LKQVRFVILSALFSSTFSFSVDSAISQVGPKEPAQKRQTESARQFCNEKAAIEKVTKRDLPSFVVGCMDAIEDAEKRSRNSQ
jgi:hypothetical protein